jgi:hypothetical protein
MNSTPPIESTRTKCFQRSSRGNIFGISFALSDGSRLLAPYAYLSHVQMNGMEELVFVYSFGEVHVTGKNLEDGYDAVQKHELFGVVCSEVIEDNPIDPQVTKITLRNTEPDDEP